MKAIVKSGKYKNKVVEIVNNETYNGGYYEVRIKAFKIVGIHKSQLKFIEE